MGRAQLSLEQDDIKLEASFAQLSSGWCVLTSSPQQSRRRRLNIPFTVSELPLSEVEAAWDPAHPLFKLLATLTKPWSRSGPTCPKLLPGNDHPCLPQSVQVQPGLPCSREAPLPTTPHDRGYPCGCQQHPAIRWRPEAK